MTLLYDFINYYINFIKFINCIYLLFILIKEYLQYIKPHLSII